MALVIWLDAKCNNDYVVEVPSLSFRWTELINIVG